MIFLIEYNRKQGRLVQFKRFKNSERIKAQGERLKTELTLNRKKIQHEVVLLEAQTESIIRRTHKRYFETLPHIEKGMLL